MDTIDSKNIWPDDCAPGIESIHCVDWVYEDEDVEDKDEEKLDLGNLDLGNWFNWSDDEGKTDECSGWFGWGC